MNYELKIIKKLFVFFILLISFFAISQSILAEENAKIYFSGPKESIAPGSEITIRVLLDSKTPINAFNLEVSYPAEELKFLGSDNTDSIVNIWKTPPKILQNGQIEFSGGILKSFLGEAGLIVKLSFKVLATGTSEFSFSRNDLYIADGKGTKLGANAPNFSFSVKEGGKIISSSITPFKTTPENILINKELEKFKSEMLWKKIYTPLLIFGVIPFVILALAVYNKFKRNE